MAISGKVAAVSVSSVKGTSKENVPSALLIADFGIDGDAHAGQSHRQISLLAVESIEKMRRLGADVRPGSFAENITTAELDLSILTVGDSIRIGDSELIVTQLGKECHSRCAIFETVGDCVMPREGIFARVARGGLIRSGDVIVVNSSVPSPPPGEHMTR